LSKRPNCPTEKKQRNDRGKKSKSEGEMEVWSREGKKNMQRNKNQKRVHHGNWCGNEGPKHGEKKVYYAKESKTIEEGEIPTNLDSNGFIRYAMKNQEKAKLCWDKKGEGVGGKKQAKFNAPYPH